MAEKMKKPVSRRHLIVVLGALEDADWRYVGDVDHLLDPNDTELLRQLVELCDEWLEEVTEERRRERLQRIRQRLHATAELNDVLPIVAPERFARRVKRTKRPRLEAGSDDEPVN